MLSEIEQWKNDLKHQPIKAIMSMYSYANDEAKQAFSLLLDDFIQIPYLNTMLPNKGMRVFALFIKNIQRPSMFGFWEDEMELLNLHEALRWLVEETVLAHDRKLIIQRFLDFFDAGQIKVRLGQKKNSTKGYYPHLYCDII